MGAMAGRLGPFAGARSEDLCDGKAVFAAVRFGWMNSRNRPKPNVQSREIAAAKLSVRGISNRDDRHASIERKSRQTKAAGALIRKTNHRRVSVRPAEPTVVGVAAGISQWLEQVQQAQERSWSNLRTGWPRFHEYDALAYRRSSKMNVAGR